MNPLLYPIAIPLLLGFLCILVPRKIKGVREVLAVLGSTGTFGLVIWLYLLYQKGDLAPWPSGGLRILFIDELSGFILLAAGLFGVLISLYSIKYMEKNPHPRMAAVAKPKIAPRFVWIASPANWTAVKNKTSSNNSRPTERKANQNSAGRLAC